MWQSGRGMAMESMCSGARTGSATGAAGPRSCAAHGVAAFWLWLVVSYTRTSHGVPAKHSSKHKNTMQSGSSDSCSGSSSDTVQQGQRSQLDQNEVLLLGQEDVNDPGICQPGVVLYDLICTAGTGQRQQGQRRNERGRDTVGGGGRWRAGGAWRRSWAARGTCF